MDIQDMKEQRQAFDEWHYNQYLLENPNIDTSSAKYIYDYAHKNVLVWQIRESHFTAWQAAKAQAVPDGYVVASTKDLNIIYDQINDWNTDWPLVFGLFNRILEAQEPAND